MAGESGSTVTDSAPTITFAQLLHRHRRAAGLTQEGPAARARLSWRAISDLERAVNHTPRRDTVAPLIEALALTGETQRIFEVAARHSVATRVENDIRAGRSLRCR